MKNTLNQYLERFQKKRRNYRRYRTVFLMLAVITVLGVNWQLHREGISMTADASGFERDVGGDDGDASGGDTSDAGDSGSDQGSDDGSSDGSGDSSDSGDSDGADDGSGDSSDSGDSDDKGDSSDDGDSGEKDDSSDNGDSDVKDDSSDNGNSDGKDDSSDDGDSGGKDDSSDDGDSEGKDDSSDDKDSAGKDNNPDDGDSDGTDGASKDSDEKSEEDESEAENGELPEGEEELEDDLNGLPEEIPEELPVDLLEDVEPVEMNKDNGVTSILLSGSGTKYDANGNLYSSDLRLDFTFEAGTVKKDSLDYYYDYPEGIIVPDGLLEKEKVLYDDNKRAGVYWFEKIENDDGEEFYRVRIRFDEKYANNNESKDISGYIQFSGQIESSTVDDDGNIKIIGKDDVTLEIPNDEINYPDGETNRYGISTKKTGSYTEDGKLKYKVTVESVKGTPGEIQFEDIIQASGLTLGDPKVTVTKETWREYHQTDGNYTNSKVDGEDETIPIEECNYSYEDGKLTMTLPQIEPEKFDVNQDGEEYYIEYTRYVVEYTFDIDSDVSSFWANNTVTTTSTDNSTTVTAKDTADVKKTGNTGYTIEKTGQPNIMEGYIVWQITVNANRLDIAGATLHDDMLSSLLGSEYKFDPDKGWEWEKDASGKITGIKFIATDGEKNENKYTIRYRTPLQGDWEGSKVTNKATFTPGGGGDERTDGATVDVPSGSFVEKKRDNAVEADGETAEVTWTVSITAPNDAIPAGTVITDDPTQGKDGKAGAPQYRTKKQVIDWAAGIYWADSGGQKVSDFSLTDDIADVVFTGSDGNRYTWQEIDASEDDTLTYTVCEITLKQDIKPPEGAAYLRFTYKTTADLSKAESGVVNYYKNSVTVGKNSAEASYPYQKDGVLKTDENNVTDTTQKTNKDGTLTWKIKASIHRETGKLTFTDSLPEGVKLVSVTGADMLQGMNTVISEDGTITSEGSQYRATGSYDGSEVRLEVTRYADGNMPAGTYTLVLVCQVNTDNIEDYKSGETYTFTNRASVRNDTAEIGSADQTQEWTEDTTQEESKVISKSGQWNNDTRLIHYEIELNPDEKDIVEGSDELTLKDVFKYHNVAYMQPPDDWTSPTTECPLNAWLVQDSVKLYRAEKNAEGKLEKGEEITDWSWTVTTGVEPDGLQRQTSTLTGTGLPDGTAMILEYDYEFQIDCEEGWHMNNSVDVSNSAELDGTAYKADDNKTSMIWVKQETSGGVTAGKSGVLYKVSKGNYGKVLSGAVFKLQKYEGGDYQDVTGVTYTTDDDGKVIIQWQTSDADIQYEYNVLYRVVETEAPDGYVLPADPEAQAFYFYFSNSENTDHTLPDSIPNGAADLSKTSKTVYVENESTNTKITILKKWLKADGTEDTGHTGTVTVELYRKESTTPPATGGTATLKGEIREYSPDNTNSDPWMKIEESFSAGSPIKLIITSDDVWIANPAYNNVPVIRINGTTIEPETEAWNGTQTVHTYTFQLNEGENEILGGTMCWKSGFGHLTAKFQVQESGNTEDNVKETFVKSCTISSSDNWTKTIKDLPTVGKNEAGETVYYTYYIKEVTGGDFTTTYENNDGIVSGTITVTNKLSNNPSYVLPETGGHGTRKYMTVGALLMSAALLGGYTRRRKAAGNPQ